MSSRKEECLQDCKVRIGSNRIFKTKLYKLSVITRRFYKYDLFAEIFQKSGSLFNFWDFALGETKAAHECQGCKF